jgi:hypothetical protein
MLRHRRSGGKGLKKSRHLQPYARPGRSEGTEMATGAQATEEIAKPAGVSLTFAERAARILKEADADLWPKARKGGGKGAAHVTPAHLVNLLLTLMAADPLTEAPAIVPRYRNLIVDRCADPEVDVFETESLNHIDRMTAILNEFCPGPNLGERLEGLVRNLMDVETRNRARKRLGSFTVGRSHQDGGSISASLDVSTGTIGFVEPLGDLFPTLRDGAEYSGTPEAAISATKSVPFRIFEILADLARDDARGHGHKPSSDAAGGTAGADTETATPAAGGTGPASADAMASQPGGNPVNLADGSNQQDSGKKKRRQRSASSAPPGSPSFDPSDRPKDEPPWPRSDLPTPTAD